MARQYGHQISSEIWCLEGARGFGLWAGEIWGSRSKVGGTTLDFGSQPGSDGVLGYPNLNRDYEYREGNNFGTIQ